MEKNFYSYKKTKWVLTTLLPLFCCLFANIAMTQDAFVWNGSSFKNSAIASRDTYLGETSGQQLNLNELSRGINFYLFNTFKTKYN
jgi:hypothetical protein